MVKGKKRNETHGKNTFKYAGFWIRIVAAAFDSILLWFVMFILGLIMKLSMLSIMTNGFIVFCLYIIIDIVNEVYFTSRFGGSIGKLLMRCKVVDSDEIPISLAAATGRYFGKILSTLALCIGYLMIAWDSKKQGIHDKLAKTYVIHNNESKVKKSWMIGVLILTLLVIMGGIGFYTIVMATSMYYSFEAQKNPLSVVDPLVDLNSKCNQSISLYQDICISTFAKTSSENNMIKIGDKLKVCNLIKKDELHRNCILQMAVSENNKELCTNSRSKYENKICIKQYDTAIEMADFAMKLENSLVTDYIFEDGLTAIGFATGRYWAENGCALASEHKFTNNETICLVFVNISGLSKNINDEVQFNVDLQVFDEDGRIVRSDRNILDGKPQKLEGENLPIGGLKMELDVYSAGKYVFQLTVHDKLTKKAITNNVTLEFVDSIIPESLSVTKFVKGKVMGDECVESDSHKFLPEDWLCIYPLGLTGFEKGIDGVHWADADKFILSKSGEILYDNAELFDEEFHGILQLDSFDKEDIQYPLDETNAGNYTFRVKYYDKLSRKEINANYNFELLGSYDYGGLETKGITKGIFQAQECVDVDSNKYTNADWICIQVDSITGFTSDNSGRYWSGHINRVKSADGKIVIEKKYSLSNANNKIIADGKLSDHRFFQELTELKPGQYVLEFDVLDWVSRKAVTLKYEFEIVDQNDFGYLTINNVDVGYQIENFECNEVSTNVLSNNEGKDICFEPRKISGFERNSVGNSWFDMDIIIKDSSGKTVAQSIRPFGKDGIVYLPTQTITGGHWLYFPSSRFEQGEYTFELSVIDMHSRKKGTLTGSFEIEAK